MSTLKTGALRGTSGTADSVQLHASDQSVTFPGAVTITGNATCSGTATGFGGGKIIKYATFTHTGPVHGDYGGDPTSTSEGYQLFSTSYTPLAADSTIVLISSSLTIGERYNACNFFWLSAFQGSTHISSVSGGASYLNYKDNLNETTLNYVGSFTSGSTTARNIMFRCGGNSSSAEDIDINGNPNGYAEGNSNKFTVFLQELSPN